MELMQLRYFKEVARLESFSRASETLHVTQSALSKSIAKLEEELEVRLFEREGNRIHLNYYGAILLRNYDQAMQNLKNGIAQVRNLAGLDDGAVRIGVSGDVFIKHLVRDFILRHPNATLVCLLQSQEQMKQSLLDGTIDYVLTTEPINQPGFVWQHLYTDHLTVLVSNQDPLSRLKEAPLSAFSGQRFIVTNLGYGMKGATEDLCRRAGFEAKVLYEGYDTEIAGQLVEAGIAVQITPHSITAGVSRFLLHEPPKKITSVRLTDESFSTKAVGLISKRGHYLSSTALEFYADIVEYFASLDS